MARKPVIATPKPGTATARKTAAKPEARPGEAEAAADRAGAERAAAEAAAGDNAAAEEKAALERAAAGKAALEAAAAAPPSLRRPIALDGLAAAAERAEALPLSDYLSVLRREIARAGAEAADEGGLPLVSLAEAEISLTCVAVAIENDRLLVDPSWKALSAAPEAAVQRLKVRLIDADMSAALREKG
ncbi:MAG: hypothetical protein ACE37J_18200 [Pikeienuella sp.]|uniref:hypothetical protein n=1 Tax=Pikeienuella sp. TaxID=2831957 RepID=UPI00391D67C4